LLAVAKHCASWVLSCGRAAAGRSSISIVKTRAKLAVAGAAEG
jgi:hypothetical protein